MPKIQLLPEGTLARQERINQFLEERIRVLASEIANTQYLKKLELLITKHNLTQFSKNRNFVLLLANFINSGFPVANIGAFFEEQQYVIAQSETFQNIVLPAGEQSPNFGSGVGGFEVGEFDPNRISSFKELLKQLKLSIIETKVGHNNDYLNRRYPYSLYRLNNGLFVFMCPQYGEATYVVITDDLDINTLSGYTKSQLKQLESQGKLGLRVINHDKNNIWVSQLSESLTSQIEQKTANSKTTKSIKTLRSKLVDTFEVSAITTAEQLKTLTPDQRAICLIHYIQNNYRPNRSSKCGFESTLGALYTGYKQRKAKISKRIINPDLELKLNRLVKLEQMEYDRNYLEIVRFYRDFNRSPNSGSNDQLEKDLNTKYVKYKQGVKGNTNQRLSNRVKILIDKIIALEQKKIDQTYIDIVDFCKYYKRLPHRKNGTSNVEKTLRDNLNRYIRAKKTNTNSRISPNVIADLDQCLELYQ